MLLPALRMDAEELSDESPSLTGVEHWLALGAGALRLLVGASRCSASGDGVFVAAIAKLRHLPETIRPASNVNAEIRSTQGEHHGRSRNAPRCISRRTARRVRRGETADEGAAEAGQGRLDPKLRQAFESHLEETHGHVERLEQVFESLDEKARGKHCDGIAGIIEEGKSIMEETSTRRRWTRA